MMVRTRLLFAPQRAGEEAGLTMRLNERAHYDLAVTKKDSANEIFVRSVCANGTVIAGTAIASGMDVFLQIETSDVEYAFSFSIDSVSYSRIAVLGAQEISPESSGAFTGAVIGMYATGNGAPCSTPADFDWFEYLPR